MRTPRNGISSASIWWRPGPIVPTTLPVLTNSAISSALTIARVDLADVDVRPLEDDLAFVIVRYGDEFTPEQRHGSFPSQVNPRRRCYPVPT